MPVGFKLNNRDGITYLTIPSFEAAGVARHAFTTRCGGASPAPFDGLNMGFKTGDAPANVVANRERACRLLGAGLDAYVAADQVHGRRVQTVDLTHRGRGALSAADALPGVDALVTGVPGLVLTSYYADCVPLLFLDPVRRVAALAHAGWQGTVLGIGAATVEHMVREHGCATADILAAVGPCIGPCCYEVDLRVMERVDSILPGEPGLARPGRPGHWWLNLPEVNRRVLLQAGIKDANITMAGLCTSCRDDLFYSHRKQGGLTGRMASLIMLTGG